MTAHWIPQGVEWAETWKEAAVLIPRFTENGVEKILLTQRSATVGHHKKQISFPGGAYEKDDLDLWQTALREAKEEVVLPPENVTRLRKLSSQYTPTGFRVTPFETQIVVPEKWIIDPNEIYKAFEVPIAHLKETRHYEFQSKEYAGHRYLDPHFYYEGYDIWGMTGRIIC